MELLNPKLTLQNTDSTFVLATLEHDFGNGELMNCTVKLRKDDLLDLQVLDLENKIVLEIGNRTRTLMK